LKEQLPPDLPISGFHSFGEFSPLSGSRESLLHNCTLVTLLVGDQDSAAAEESHRPGGWANRAQYRTRKAMTMDALKRENEFLKKRLNRSEYYRQRLEVYKDQNDALMRKIHFDMHRAHLEIQHKNELLRKSLALANEIQLNLLPQSNPSNPHFDIAGRSIFCSATGGDYYDFIPRSDENRTQLSVAVGDVTGHGIEAALLMTTARALLRSRALMPGSMAQIIGDVNQHLTQDLNESGRFITLFLLTIDPVTCSLNWVRAGHDPAICYDPATDTFDELRGSGLALGVDLNWHYEENRKSGLTDGQVIFLGTDGIWETHDPRGNMFGKAAVHDIIRAHAADDAELIVKTVIDNLNDFRKTAEPEDDITLIVIKVKENGNPCHR
jgi:serine phosphatase RsbU (regulator of sigma subunit)